MVERAMLHLSRPTLLALASAVVLAGFGGCGGDDTDEQRLTEERISKERKEAARIARQEERVRQLEKELREQKKQRGNNTAPPAPSAPSTPAPTSSTAPAGTSSCGGGIYVNSATTCPFAQNVRDEYNSSGGSGDMTVTAFSPATGRTFLMTCSGGSPHVCYGGNNARVYFP
jgi:hypothetical protein